MQVVTYIRQVAAKVVGALFIAHLNNNAIKKHNHHFIYNIAGKFAQSNSIYDKAGKFAQSNSIARACFISQLCTLITQQRKFLFIQYLNYGIENALKQLVHVSVGHSSRYEALGKFGEHSRSQSTVALGYSLSNVLSTVKKAMGQPFTIRQRQQTA